MIMCDLDLCNVCWSFVDMSTNSMVKNIKFDQDILVEYEVKLVLSFADFWISLGCFRNNLKSVHEKFKKFYWE
jgi:hypothetical protein